MSLFLPANCWVGLGCVQRPHSRVCVIRVCVESHHTDLQATQKEQANWLTNAFFNTRAVRIRSRYTVCLLLSRLGELGRPITPVRWGWFGELYFDGMWCLFFWWSMLMVDVEWWLMLMIDDDCSWFMMIVDWCCWLIMVHDWWWLLIDVDDW